MERIGIVGAGATGAYLAARFSRAGIPVTLAARGGSARRIRERGIDVVDGDGSWNARPDTLVDTDGEGRPLEPVDVVVVCVKTYDTESVLPLIERLRGPGTRVLSLQNGVRADAVLAKAFGSNTVLSGVLYIGAHRNGPGQVECTVPPRVLVGPYTGASPEGAEGFAAVCQEAGIDVTATAQILTGKWQKFVFNCGLNPLTALSGRRIGELLADPLTREVFTDLVDEAYAVGVASGAPLAVDAREQALATAASMDISSSMAEDRAAGRTLELDAFGGHVIDLAREHGIPVPVTRTVHALLRV